MCSAIDLKLFVIPVNILGKLSGNGYRSVESYLC